MLTRRVARSFSLFAAAAVCAATPAIASSSNASLGVSVTVVRSCAVHAAPGERGSAQVRLTCAPGAASAVRGRKVGTGENARTLQLRLPTSSFRQTTDRGVEVVTLNF